MPDENQSQADILREIIDSKIDEDFDFGNLSKKRELKAEILAKHPNLFTKKSLDSYFHDLLKKRLVKKGKDPRIYNISVKAPKITLGDSDMNPNIKLETAPAPEPSNAQQMEAAKSQTSTQTAHTAPTADKSWTDGIDVDGVGATFSALVMTIRMAFPEMEGLTDEEKKSLGKLWLPAFKKYLSEMQAIVLIPLMATVALIAPKIGKARKLKAQKKEEDEKKSKDDSTT